MPYPHDDAKLKAWCDGLDADYTRHPDAWGQHDAAIISTVNDYNAWLQGKAGFTRLDWMLVKAQAWVETGANRPEWNSNVLQIGVNGDPGLNQILNTPTGQLIVPPQYKPFLSISAVRSVPLHNIRAGVGYLLWGAAHFGLVDVPVREREPMPGWTPPETGGTSNAYPQPPQPPQPRTHKALSITGWRTISPATIAQRYNAGGDGNYYSKLIHAYAVITGGVKGAGK